MCSSGYSTRSVSFLPHVNSGHCLVALLCYVKKASLTVHTQVLQFMRTNISTSKGRQLVGVWMKGAAQYLHITSQAFTKAVKESGLGYNQDKRPFLKDGSKDTVFTDSSTVRRSCTCAFLDDLPSDVVAGIRTG